MDRFRQFRARFARRVAPNNGNDTPRQNNGGWKNMNAKTNGNKAIQYKKGIFGTKYRTKNSQTPVYKYGNNNYSTANQNNVHIINSARRLVNTHGGESNAKIQNMLRHRGLYGGSRPSASGGNRNHQLTISELRKQASRLLKLQAATANSAALNAKLRSVISNRLNELKRKGY